jgi:hypothetical protein
MAQLAWAERSGTPLQGCSLAPTTSQGFALGSYVSPLRGSMGLRTEQARRSSGTAGLTLTVTGTV